MRPVERGSWPTNSDGDRKAYAEYGDAQIDLYERLGEYCSYCEMRVADCMDVEHILPKGVPLHQYLERDWSNFLLACKRCNDIKGRDDINRADYFWPDIDNTFRALLYSDGGIVQVAPNLSVTDQQKAQQTLILTGLDRRPGHSKFAAKDRRWIDRRDAWGIAQTALSNMHSSDSPQLRATIIALSKKTGFWSIWMTVFQADKAMTKELIAAFPGTCTSCFDDHGEAQPRPNGSL